jgi:hypothetical protein
MSFSIECGDSTKASRLDRGSCYQSTAMIDSDVTAHIANHYYFFNIFEEVIFWGSVDE